MVNFTFSLMLLFLITDTCFILQTTNPDNFGSGERRFEDLGCVRVYGHTESVSCLTFIKVLRIDVAYSEVITYVYVGFYYFVRENDI